MLPERLVAMKLLPSPGRAEVTSSRLEKPGSAPGPKAERRICRCTSRNSSEIRVRVRDQSTMPARSSATASMAGRACGGIAGQAAWPEVSPGRRVRPGIEGDARLGDTRLGDVGLGDVGLGDVGLGDVRPTADCGSGLAAACG